MSEELLTGGLLSDCFLKDSLITVSDFLDQALWAIQEPVSCSEAHKVVAATLFDTLLILLLELFAFS